MADQIEANYEQLEQLANQFANNSQAIQEMIQKVRGSMDKLRNEGWIGRGSDAFFNEMDQEVLPATDRLKEALEQASQLTKEIVNIMQDAEEEASRPFHN